jgi:hypothetical protein
MMNKLQLVDKNLRLTCTWVSTGDMKRPLACVWGYSKTPREVSAASADSEAGGLHLCA